MTLHREVEWGNWGLTFLSWMGDRRPYVARIHGVKYFPIGARGPVDGIIGSSERRQWQEMVRGWMADGTLPEGLDMRHATAAQVA